MFLRKFRYLFSNKENITDNKSTLFSCRTSGIVLNDKNETLIIKRNDCYHFEQRDSDAHVGWEFCGGGLEHGETPEEGIVREYEEETGIKIDVIDVYNVRTGFREGRHLLNICYICKYISGEVKLTDEHVEYKWIPIVSLNEYDFGKHSSKDILKFFEFIKKHKIFGM